MRRVVSAGSLGMMDVDEVEGLIGASFDRSSEMYGYQQLALRVLLKAMSDAQIKGIRSRYARGSVEAAPADPRDIASARAFLTQDSQRLDLWCGLIGVDAGALRDWVQRRGFRRVAVRRGA